VAAGDNVNGIGVDVNSGSSDKVSGSVIAELIGNLLLDIGLEKPDGFWKLEVSIDLKIKKI
jgi:hypothetical protein